MEINRDIDSKLNNLNNTKASLKLEFIGLDNIIDELCNAIESWYLFPNAQVRPTIVNLWGMTGTGKTSLVKRLFQLLNFGSVIKFDIGDWLDDVESELKNKISEQVRNVYDENSIPVFVFDEFQLGRTISKQEDDVDRSGLRVIWDLMDSGKIEMVGNNHWNCNRLFKLYNKLSYCIKNGVCCKKGSITKNKKVADNIFIKDNDTEEEPKEQAIKDPFLPYESYWVLLETQPDKFLSITQLEEYVIGLSDQESILKFIHDAIISIMKPTEYDFSNSLIFNIGNLDEAYVLSGDMDPDMDPDSLYEFTDKITIVDIKDALSQRFRSEQIARLGNTHIIYKSFKSEHYRSLIKMELGKINDRVKERFGLSFDFCESVNSLIYSEGVFPSQGVRPIFSTMKNLIESYIGKILSEVMRSSVGVDTISWDFDRTCGKYKVTIGGGKVVEFPVQLKIENLRKSDNSDEQSLVAIHEAGHAITSIYALGICPKVIMTKTASSCNGFCHIDLPEYETKEMIINNIITTVGGLAAERLVFGDNNVTNGSYSDIKSATSMLLKMVKSYGMDEIPLLLEHDHYNDMINQGDVAIKTKKGEKMFEMMNTMSFKSSEILKKNMRLLLELGKYLTENSKIEEATLKDMVYDFGSTEPVYKDKDKYYNFKSIMEKQLEGLENKE